LFLQIKSEAINNHVWRKSYDEREQIQLLSFRTGSTHP
jgi:hypothetical protein